MRWRPRRAVVQQHRSTPPLTPRPVADILRWRSGSPSLRDQGAVEKIRRRPASWRAAPSPFHGSPSGWTGTRFPVLPRGRTPAPRWCTTRMTDRACGLVAADAGECPHHGDERDRRCRPRACRPLSGGAAPRPQGGAAHRGTRPARPAGADRRRQDDAPAGPRGSTGTADRRGDGGWHRGRGGAVSRPAAAGVRPPGHRPTARTHTPRVPHRAPGP